MVIYPRPLTGGHAMISFAQNQEDVLIDRVFRKQTGFFIDVGAFDPVVDSVTKYFSLAGWRGINIEPHSAGLAEFRRDRPNEINLPCVLGRTRGEATYYQLENKGLSTISLDQLAVLGARDRAGAQRLTVEMRTLADVCAEFVTSEIDFLKIDVEGAEEEVIYGADWDRFRPRLLVIEATKPNSSEPNWAAWEPYLLSRGYRFQFFDGLNRYYLRREDEGLAGQLSVPANILDVYVPHREVRLRLLLEQHQRELERMRNALAMPSLPASLAGTTLNIFPTPPAEG
jgi:FkbM family methyltransferase